jgi:putative Holliday junction resolvase
MSAIIVNLYSQIYTSLMNDYSNYSRFKQFLGKRILSIDFGTKVIGTAMFCPGRDPFPYSADKIIYKSHSESIESLLSIVSNEDIEIVVIGIPYFIDGKESTSTVNVRAFAEQLKSALITQDLYEQDETLTTKAAEERMMNSPEFNFKIDPTKIDCVSATIILEDFIRG